MGFDNGPVFSDIFPPGVFCMLSREEIIDDCDLWFVDIINVFLKGQGRSNCFTTSFLHDCILLLVVINTVDLHQVLCTNIVDDIFFRTTHQLILRHWIEQVFSIDGQAISMREPLSPVSPGLRQSLAQLLPSYSLAQVEFRALHQWTDRYEWQKCIVFVLKQCN